MKTRVSVMVVAMVALCWTSEAGRADASYSDGGTHDISTTIQGVVGSGVGIGNATTVNVLAGASITGRGGITFGTDGVSVGGSSTLNVLDGTIKGGTGTTSGGNGIYASRSTVTVSGGTITGGEGGTSGGNGIFASNSTVKVYGGSMTGGNFDCGLYAASSSLIKVYDGEVKGPTGNGIEVAPTADLTCMEGTATGSYSNYGILATPGSKVNIYGGQITGGINAWMSGATPIFEIFGSGFNYGQGPISVLSGTLTGTLADGTIFSWPFRQSSPGEIVLSAAPEPATVVLLAAGAMAVRRVKSEKRKVKSVGRRR